MDAGGYVTDGRHLFEVIAVRIEPGRKEQFNYGAMGGQTKPTPDKLFYTVRNARTGYVWEEMDAEAFAVFREVVPDAEHAASLLHAELELWAEKRPAWMA